MGIRSAAGALHARVIAIGIVLGLLGAATLGLTMRDDWASITYFKPEDFWCKGKGCCIKDATADIELVRRLEAIRNKIDRPILVTSGCRCKKHNEAVGGVADSAHVPRHGTCCAADIHCPDDAFRYAFIREAVTLFPRIGIGHHFIHVDMDPLKKDHVMWTYYGKGKDQ